jgi:hypothetical protein
MSRTYDNYYGTIILDVICCNAPDTMAPLRNTNFPLCASGTRPQLLTKVESITPSGTIGLLCGAWFDFALTFRKPFVKPRSPQRCIPPQHVSGTPSPGHYSYQPIPSRLSTALGNSVKSAPCPSVNTSPSSSSSRSSRPSTCLPFIQ